MPNQVPAYAGQRLVVHGCDCHMQATKWQQSFVPFRSAVQVAVLVLPEPYCQPVSAVSTHADTLLALTPAVLGCTGQSSNGGTQS